MAGSESRDGVRRVHQIRDLGNEPGGAFAAQKVLHIEFLEESLEDPSVLHPSRRNRDPSHFADVPRFLPAR